MLRIAVQSKGRLYEDTMNLLNEASIKFVSGKRKLLIPSKNFPAEVLYLRDDDIPQTVASGVADIGIVGLNEFEEKNEDAEIIKKLGFSKCRLSIAIPQNIEYTGIKWLEGKTIATSYPVILNKFLKRNNINCKLHVITGSVEIAPNIGLADGIFDIVSSGSTLISNRLKEVEVAMESEAVLIACKGLSDEKKKILDELIFRIEAAEKAQNNKYILMNVPNDKINEIVKMLPGMKSPTVMPLAEEGWSSLHTVIATNKFWEIIGKLKKLGAEGILVLPIDNMIL